MILTKDELKKCLSYDKLKYYRGSIIKNIADVICYRENIVLWHYVRLMRLCDYYTNNRNKSPFHYLMYLWYSRKYNRRCIELGLMIGCGAFDEGLCIYHTGNIVVNGYCKIGKNCRLHGSNCIGNSHREDDCPTIGDNVRFGVGAKAFGNIYIANNITVAAGAVVTKSCYEEGVTLAGIPAKIIKHDNSKNCK